MSIAEILQFVAIPEGTTIWDVLNSQFLVAIVAAFLGVKLNKRLREVKESTEDAAEIGVLQQEIDADSDESLKAAECINNRSLESLPTTKESPLAPHDPAREEGLELIGNLKGKIECLIKKADGRHKRTYERIPRYNYRLLIQSMAARTDLSERQATAADLAFRLWQPHSRGLGANTPVSRAVIESIKAALEQFR